MKTESIVVLAIILGAIGALALGLNSIKDELEGALNKRPEPTIFRSCGELKPEPDPTRFVRCVGWEEQAEDGERFVYYQCSDGDSGLIDRHGSICHYRAKAIIE